MSEHTKGPWKAEYSDGDWFVCCDGGDLAGLYGCATPDEEAANARLMAAAPELLEAAEEALRWLQVLAGVARLRQEDKLLGNIHDIIDRTGLVEAITKAGGKTMPDQPTGI